MRGTLYILKDIREYAVRPNLNIILVLDMYPVYPELGWIHSVSSVSQLSEAAYTRALSGSRSLMPI